MVPHNHLKNTHTCARAGRGLLQLQYQSGHPLPCTLSSTIRRLYLLDNLCKKHGEQLQAGRVDTPARFDDERYEGRCTSSSSCRRRGLPAAAALPAIGIAILEYSHTCTYSSIALLQYCNIAILQYMY